MKRLISTIITAFAAVAAFGFAAQCFATEGFGTFHAPDRDVRGDMARMGNDLPAFLHYQPTDGATHAGKVRASMDLTKVQAD